MQDGKFAIYIGKKYLSGKNKDGKIILRSSNIKDIENGFEPCEPFIFKNYEEKIVCLKLVNRSEVEDYYRLKTKAIYAGFVFDIVEELEDMISIVATVGDYRDWLNLGMKCMDKGIYQKWVNKNEVEIKIVKEQL